jgi:cytochrome c oxidase cbb3-type subunit IV
MFYSVFQSVWTVVVFVIFMGITFWAYSSKRKAHFDEINRDLLDDDDSIKSTKDKHNV